MGQIGDQDSDRVASDLQNEHKTDTQVEKESKKTHKCNYPDCQAVFPRSSKLERHMRLHTGEVTIRPYQCSHLGCTKSYTNSSHLKRHLETHNLVKKAYECTKCSMTVSSLHNLRRHYKRTHCELFCKECDLTFSKKYQLNKHLAQHLGLRGPYKCDKCNISYMSGYRFRLHKMMHEKRYPCPVSGCSEVFDQCVLMRKHKAKHYYTCDVCSKVFLGLGRFKTHCKIHSENKVSIPCPYDNCHKVYTSNSNLNTHVRAKHLGVKFYCDLCSVGLVSKKRLEIHIQSHYAKSKPKKEKKKPSKRKDAGIPKKSNLSALIGVNFSHHLEQMIMKRETKINDTPTTVEVSS
ncbi:MDS1 and EVI1 complex locus protein EVI1-A isoform X1 [Solenopsis invicta]|uniref:MDS1 and EVI1 complex locus protein EVI1-A isoform X1 n=1 Tax=Solenopsis invicta TaxID=13686 RepID=UPI00193E1D58|nr:MDS1 and EVI1 complex locus protein EVI1-A isoform X1 [Solenopsis invicta]XP_039307597.1 MDS1 and EVI1 complex locus protein EVI1-A isoform X1 [Solenopsis invicta]XP_039307598.1 MDS1 and EVI1 complex locus protein EVI1-A isoform X1 [Solenopsis invicta]